MICNFIFDCVTVKTENTDLRTMIGCIGDDIVTRNIIRQVICEDIVTVKVAEDPYTRVGLSVVGSIEKLCLH